MLSREENELITRVGPGTPMGETLRRYWVPGCLAEELPEPDCDPIRLRLLGEDLVVFRDSAGRVGVMDEHCPHRGASLYFGRNEEGGLRCIYHGWKMDVDGNVLDTPCEPADSDFKHRVKHTAYSVREAADLVWVYMGPRAEMPRFPDFAWTAVPSTNRSIGKVLEHANWVQALEGALDSAHADVLHSGWRQMGLTAEQARERLLRYEEAVLARRPAQDPSPRFDTQDTDYGMRYAAIRKPLDDPDRSRYVRVTIFVLPFYCMTPPPDGEIGGAHVFVPADDEHVWFFDVRARQSAEIDHEEHLASRNLLVGVDLDGGHHRTHRTAADDYLQDRGAMRARRSYSGILAGNPHQDMAVVESMGPIYDRTKEHLGVSDTAIIRMRRRLIDSVQALQRGDRPIGLDPSIPYERIRAGQKVIPVEEPWETVGAYAGEYSRVAQPTAG